ncbi:MAG: glutathione S-transferase C-terminal domain-containing protein [Myxococcota bacterium]
MLQDQDLGVLSSSGTAWGHFLAICTAHAGSARLWLVDEVHDQFLGPSLDAAVLEGLRAHGVKPPQVFAMEDGSPQTGDPKAWGRLLAPDLSQGSLAQVETELLEPLESLVGLHDQGAYEAAHARLADSFRTWDARLAEQRYVDGETWGLADVLLFVILVRLDPVYYELHKATVGLLRDFDHLWAFARDLYEEPAFADTTDFNTMKFVAQRGRPMLNPQGLVPRGGIPDLDAPHERHFRFALVDVRSGGAEEAPRGQRTRGEWVRPASKLRSWLGSDEFPAVPGRYHLYAPYNCPWSHRALLGRAVKGLQDLVGASIVYFRRDPEQGWQFNPKIPGCTPDLEGQRTFVRELYEEVGSAERSVPVLWDTVSRRIVSNESADILRMFNSAFGKEAKRQLELVPPEKEAEINRLNELVYQRLSNGAYKAGFAKSQAAYERAYARYFSMIDWLEERLRTRSWLADTEQPSEADLRLFPTIVRHDTIYYSRFRLNRSRIREQRALSGWLNRMMGLPGVSEASNLDHARNGYFGRTGNQIVPAGPVPLELSPKDYGPEVWRR